MKKTVLNPDQVKNNVIVEIILNRTTKNLTIKYWEPIKSNGQKMYHLYMRLETYTTEIKDLYYYSYKDIINLHRWDLKNTTDYPYKKKHVSKFNLY